MPVWSKDGMLGASGSLLGLSSIAVGLRFHARRSQGDELMADDGLAVAAWASRPNLPYCLPRCDQLANQPFRSKIRYLAYSIINFISMCIHFMEISYTCPRSCILGIGIINVTLETGVDNKINGHRTSDFSQAEASAMTELSQKVRCPTKSGMTRPSLQLPAVCSKSYAWPVSN